MGWHLLGHTQNTPSRLLKRVWFHVCTLGVCFCPTHQPSCAQHSQCQYSSISSHPQHKRIILHTQPWSPAITPNLTSHLTMISHLVIRYYDWSARQQVCITIRISCKLHHLLLYNIKYMYICWEFIVRVASLRLENFKLLSFIYV